jgi:hypothetical protein
MLNLDSQADKLQKETNKIKSVIKPVVEELKGVDAEIQDPLTSSDRKKALT